MLNGGGVLERGWHGLSQLVYFRAWSHDSGPGMSEKVSHAG